ncbi:YdeI/OmpD-associated family protein [Dyadobacter diqingensis]|uniref:YdeI/OmpD-associated family protein n=1 Tax=Dyadobacter diqingensis TaxID=2938121 RepID=UPI0020C1ACB5|nr:YdeI/OmpD-associated family protein [Dyadobacter diqingensis]
MTESEIKTFCPVSRQQWRAWLEAHHEQEKSVWLIFYKNKSNLPTITWSEAVDEALCFGWIDSIAKPLDEERFMRFFSRRKAKSVWSKINKEKVRRLTDEGLITQAGFDCIETAKQNGSWTILDEAEELIIPADLDEELQKIPNAKSYFLSLSKSDKRNILQWLVQAKRAETRQNRITEIVTLAAQNLKPKVIQWTKK